MHWWQSYKMSYERASCALEVCCEPPCNCAKIGQCPKCGPDTCLAGYNFAPCNLARTLGFNSKSAFSTARTLTLGARQRKKERAHFPSLSCDTQNIICAFVFVLEVLLLLFSMWFHLDLHSMEDTQHFTP